MMIFLKLLLSSGFMFIAETASIRNESSLCCDPSEYINPIHYDIKLISYIEGHILHGEYNISISIFNKTQDVFLHSEKLCIKNIILFSNIKKYENDKDTVYNSTYNIDENIIHVSFSDELSPGNYTLNIKYLGIADKIFRIFDTKGKIALIGATQFHIICTRRLSSCWNEQNLLLEATFNISIGCNQCTALSNIPLRQTEENKFKMLWTHFATTSAMSPYLATMIVSNYLLRIDKNTRNIEMWCRNESGFHIEFAENVAENITLLFKNEWKQCSNNISKVTHVAIPNFHDNGIIVFGLVFYKEADIIYNENLYPIAHKIEVAQLVGRKVTQEWFNNMLNDPLVSDFWFKKGLILLLATYAVNKTYPDYPIINLFVVQNQHYSFNLDSDYYMWNFTSQVNSSLEIPNSIKAPFIVRMMQHAFGHIFWKNILSYANSTLSHCLDSVNHLNVAFEMNDVVYLTRMEYWHSEKHCPLIKVKRNYSDPMSQTTVSIQYIDILKIRHIPITFTTEASLNFNNFTHHFLNLYVSQDLKLLLPFKEGGWMIFNIQQVGYYRVNYDDENWRRISSYLKSDNYTKIHVLNRAQIIDDAFHLMIANQLQTHIFWNLIEYLQQEEDYIAWYPMFKALEYMYGTFPWREPDGNITFRIRHALYTVLERIKYEEIDDADEFRVCLRQEAARWACFLDSITCKRKANNKLEQHLQDPTKHKLLPWWKEWTYCNGLTITTNKESWELVYDIGYEKFDPKFLEYLTCPKDNDIIKDYLRIKSIRKREIQYLVTNFLHIITKHAKNGDILQYILDDFFNIKPKHVGVIAALLIMINNVYRENLAEFLNNYVTFMVDSKDLYVGIKEKDFIIQNYDKIISKTLIRKHQIKEQRVHFESLFVWNMCM
ncbi:thyrotropin-releasing hormone-degrading ectoenzyme-like [Nylanderia fulva]|uniref:thyrotropin-releasing hormone-degrading ectoenzyme-like n=1 Tax=Nylanderia fulva TaxID=613905 RepID=UPI0010FB0E60|nr:thyrotropin-releasing hormone-degrading ectoenzyme-like [Nylanderia fulva]